MIQGLVLERTECRTLTRSVSEDIVTVRPRLRFGLGCGRDLIRGERHATESAISRRFCSIISQRFSSGRSFTLEPNGFSISTPISSMPNKT